MIETGRLRLRPWKEKDLPEFIRVTNTEAVMQHLGGVTGPGHFRIVFERMRDSQETEGFCFWLAERRADGALLGFCGFKRGSMGPITGELEIGWRFREDVWGNGYAREAARACLDWAWAKQPENIDLCHHGAAEHQEPGADGAAGDGAAHGSGFRACELSGGPCASAPYHLFHRPAGCTARAERKRGPGMRRHRHHHHHRDYPPALSLGALALGAFATGAFAVGAFAIGFLAINRIVIKHARIRKLEVDELVIRKIEKPSA